jgi:hypothetical protein
MKEREAMENSTHDPRRTRERAVIETMQLNGMDRLTAETFVDNFIAAFEWQMIEGTPSEAGPPKGIFSR